MSQQEKTPPAISEVTNLDDLIVAYDMRKLAAEARTEFETLISTRELLGQDAIGSFFNLKLKDDARN